MLSLGTSHSGSSSVPALTELWPDAWPSDTDVRIIRPLVYQLRQWATKYKFKIELLNMFRLFKAICKDYKNTLNKTMYCLKLLRFHIMDMICLWGLSIFLYQNRSTVFRFVPLCRRLILYRFLDCLSIHYYQFECSQKAKTDEDYQPQLFSWLD